MSQVISSVNQNYTNMSLKIFLLLSIAVSYGIAMKCYHCYDLYNGTRLAFRDHGDLFVKCEKNQKDWNVRDCPRDWPVCIVMATTSKFNHEVVRTCAANNFCSLYTPANGTILESCRECDTPLCNDFVGFPVPPENSGPLFVFNINLRVNKYSLKSSKSDEL